MAYKSVNVEITQEHFDRSIKGSPKEAVIAALLNQEGVPTPATYANLPVARPGPYTGLWSSERISDMLQNETYIGNMVQGRSVKISYKS